MDELLAILPVSGVVGDRKFVHSNHLYSVAALADNSGNVVERYRYDAYGQRTVLAADGVTTRSGSSYGYGFTGRYLDKGTGLWYFRSRMYSGSLGRFVSRDPWRKIENKASSGDRYQDGMSLYQGYFIPNGIDPSGIMGSQGKCNKKKKDDCTAEERQAARQACSDAILNVRFAQAAAFLACGAATQSDDPFTAGGCLLALAYLAQVSFQAEVICSHPCNW